MGQGHDSLPAAASADSAAGHAVGSSDYLRLLHNSSLPSDTDADADLQQIPSLAAPSSNSDAGSASQGQTTAQHEVAGQHEGQARRPPEALLSIWRNVVTRVFAGPPQVAPEAVRHHAL